MSAFKQDDGVRAEVFKMAAYYREKVDDFVLDMYAEEFAQAGLTLEQIRFGYLKLRRNPRVTRLPLPAAVIQVVRPELDPVEEAKELAGTIFKAIAQCGSYSGKSAREMIGKAGWSVVERMGGWNSLCRSVSIENETHYMAQIRELCIVAVKREGGAKTQSEWSNQLIEVATNSVPGLPEPMNDADFVRTPDAQIKMLTAPKEEQILELTMKAPLTESEFVERQKQMVENLKREDF